MNIDFDPLEVGEANYIEPLGVNMAEIPEYLNMEAEDEAVKGSEDQIKSIYVKAGEDLSDFLYRYKAKDSYVMLYPRCILC